MITAFQADAFQNNAFQIEAEGEPPGEEEQAIELAGLALLAWKRRRIKKRHAQLAEVAEVVQQVVEAVVNPPGARRSDASEREAKPAKVGLPPSFLRYEPAVIAGQLLRTETLDQLRQIKRGDEMLKRIQQALDDLDDEEILLLI